MANMLYLGDGVITTIRDVTVASEMTDEHIIYRYLGNEEDYLHGKLYYHNGTIFEPIGTGSGGGGGGSDEGNAAVITAQNTTGWLAKTISYGQSVTLSILWSSIEDDMPTGDGTLQVIVNGATIRTMNVAQGNVSVPVTSYIVAGANTIRLRVSDVYGNARNISYSIKAVQLVLTSNFDADSVYNAGSLIDYTYTPNGAVDKTVYFVVDGESIASTVVTTSGRQQTQTLDGMSHGAHSLQVFFTAEVDGEEVTSNILNYDLIVVDQSSNVPVISTAFNLTEVEQYTVLTIPYKVYTPNSLTSDIVLSANGEQVTALTVDRTEQTWTYRADSIGNLELSIKTGKVSKDITLVVNESEIDVKPETNALALYLSSYGRSNTEANPEIWKDEEHDISASLTGFNFVSDGWLKDNEGYTVLRISGTARVTIPYKPFSKDFRGTGKTIEVEFATRDILDYDAVVFSCMSGGRGIQLTAQVATLKSEQSTISTQYKEEEHITVSFVVEKRNENRLIYIAINGINSGVIQYPSDDDFSQMTPVNISIGATGCTTDIYHIRIYDNDLTRHQILNNWIADTLSGALMKERYEHNNVYDEYGQIVISKLPKDLPYFILNAAELPQYKGDKKTITGSYIDPEHPAKSFTFRGCQINVQGTSSAPYARKNYDMQFKSGFDMNNGGHEDNYALAPTVIPFNRFVLKADVASSEGANNVELVKLYNDSTPFKRREQETDSKVRQGIYGFPIVVFWHDTVNNVTTFLGKYNFNLPKRAPGPYGYSGNMESWEFQNNTSDLMLFKTDYFDQTMITDPTTGEAKEAWRYDYEARFPSDEWVNFAKLQELESFVVSCDRTKATGNALPSVVTYGEQTYSTDTEEYRLARFRNEFSKYAEVSSFIFYYIFTELFLMVDSRAKNLFIGFSGSDATETIAIDRKAVAEPYDMDTAIGTNNEGFLVFGYSLEDIDHLSDDADVFNGQNSVLWVNVRDAFPSEIVSMYQTLRSTGVLSYSNVKQRFEDHQSKWPEAIFNEDAYFKYIAPLTDPDTGKEPTDFYLPMLQGSKAEQRKWWLFNRFRYMDSKWNAGDALSEVIQLRGYAKADITVTPYADIYPTVKYASYLVSQRGSHGVPATLKCPLDNVNDTEIYIYSASQIASAGDLSGLKVRVADFSKATKIQSIIVGSAASDYDNPNLETLSIPASTLLRLVDVRNCSKYSGTLDLSQASNLEEVYLDGTSITSATFPVGGILKKLHLPATVTNLTIRNQPSITEFVMPDYSSITTLRVENSSSAIPILDILDDIPANSRVRIIGFTMTVSTTKEVEDFYTYLDTMRGLDENGNNLDYAVVAGTITGLDTITGEWLARMQAKYPNVIITYNHITSTITYKTYDGSSIIDTEAVADGGNGTKTNSTARASDAQYTYSPNGWSTVANGDKDDDALKNVTADRIVYAAYSKTIRKYNVYFVRSSDDGGGTLQILTDIAYGTSITAASSYRGDTPTTTRGDASDYPFEGWNPESATVTGNITFTAKFGSPIEVVEITDTWDQIIASIDAGTYKTRYKIGNYKPLDLGTAYGTTYGTVNMQIVSFDGDVNRYNESIPITFVAIELINYTAASSPWYGANGLQARIQNAFLTLLQESIKERLVEASKHYTYDTETERYFGYYKLWVPSLREICGEGAYGAETVGVIYDSVYDTVASRKKIIAGHEDMGYQRWRLRGCKESSIAHYITKGGYAEFTSSAGYTCLGFCLGLEQETITDSWETILANENPSESYSIGDTKYLDFGTLGKHLMEIVDFNADDKADGSGKAKITWISKHIIADRQINNTNNVDGGWANCSLRAYLNDTVINLIPDNVKNSIVAVTKKSSVYDNAHNKVVNDGCTTSDKIWIPSYNEVFNSAVIETGASYSLRFTEPSNRKKSIRGKKSSRWWLRSGVNTVGYSIVTAYGDDDNNIATNLKGVVVGFCTN